MCLNARTDMDDLFDFLVVVPDNVILVDSVMIECTVSILDTLVDKTIRIFRWQKGQGEIEYTDGKPNKKIATLSEVFEYSDIVTLVTDQRAQDLKRKQAEEKAQDDFLKSWDYFRAKRNQLLRSLDVPVLQFLELGERVPANLVQLRNQLRRLPLEEADPLKVNWEAMEMQVQTWLNSEST